MLASCTTCQQRQGVQSSQFLSQDVLEKVDGRTAVINNRDASSREQVAALLATADALVEANQGVALPLSRHTASSHAPGLTR